VRAAEGVRAVHRDDAVDQAASVLDQLGDEVGADALDRVGPGHRVAAARQAVLGPRLLDAAGEDRRVVGLDDDDPGPRGSRLEHAGDALERAAGAEAGDPVVEPELGEVLQDLDRRRARVDLGVGLVLELAGHEPAVRVGQLLRLAEHADAGLDGGSEHDLGPVEAHELAALDAERLRHDDDQGIAALRADHGQPDPGVPARGLDDGLAGPQGARAFGGLDDAERQPILDRAARVHALQLGEQVRSRGSEPAKAEHRGPADDLGHMVVDGHLAIMAREAGPVKAG
jgi:hypothetical protein